MAMPMAIPTAMATRSVQHPPQQLPLHRLHVQALHRPCPRLQQQLVTSVSGATK